MQSSNYDALEAWDAAIANGTPDADRVTQCNAASVAVPVAVPTGQWEGYLLASGFTIALQDYAGGSAPSGASAASIGAAKMILLLLSSSAVAAVDMTNATVAAEVTACLNALVTEGVAGRLLSMAGAPFAQSDMAALLAMGQVTVSPASQMGFRKGITVDDLTAARDPKRGAG